MGARLWRETALLDLRKADFELCPRRVIDAGPECGIAIRVRVNSTGRYWELKLLPGSGVRCVNESPFARQWGNRKSYVMIHLCQQWVFVRKNVIRKTNDHFNCEIRETCFIQF